MFKNSFTCTFKEEELQLIDALAKEYQCSPREVISTALLFNRAFLGIPDPYECCLGEWIRYYEELERDDVCFDPQEAQS